MFSAPFFLNTVDFQNTQFINYKIILEKTKNLIEFDSSTLFFLFHDKSKFVKAL